MGCDGRRAKLRRATGASAGSAACLEAAAAPLLPSPELSDTGLQCPSGENHCEAIIIAVMAPAAEC